MSNTQSLVSDEFVRVVADAMAQVLFPIAEAQVADFVREVYEGTRPNPKHKRKAKRARP